jgi:hypothetical protein
MDQLMQKLMISKAIMDKTNGINRGDVININSPNNMVESFDIPQAKYNIPQEFLQEQPSPRMNQQPNYMPVENTKPVGVPTVDAIKNSKLPDEIKRLMMEHPISQPQQQQSATLSNDLIERASRLMKESPQNYKPESATPKPQASSSSLDYNVIQKMITEAVQFDSIENTILINAVNQAGKTEQFTQFLRLLPTEADVITLNFFICLSFTSVRANIAADPGTMLRDMFTLPAQLALLLFVPQ